jgi:hypothetical protein
MRVVDDGVAADRCTAVVSGRRDLQLGASRSAAYERQNSSLSNYGLLRRNTDRRHRHRGAQLAFFVAILLIIRLFDLTERQTG